MTVQHLDNICIVVEDLEGATDFFTGLGVQPVARYAPGGHWIDRVTALDGLQADVVMLQTGEGHDRIQLMRFRRPRARGGETGAPLNTLGLHYLSLTVDDLDAALARVHERGYELVGEVVTDDTGAHRMGYVRGPQGIIVLLAAEIG